MCGWLYVSKITIVNVLFSAVFRRKKIDFLSPQNWCLGVIASLDRKIGTIVSDSTNFNWKTIYFLRFFLSPKKSFLRNELNLKRVRCVMLITFSRKFSWCAVCNVPFQLFCSSLLGSNKRQLHDCSFAPWNDQNKNGYLIEWSRRKHLYRITVCARANATHRR